LAQRVGLFGATGYTGHEAARLLRAHPEIELAFTTGSGEGHLPHEQGLERAADAYLLCLPHGVSARYAAALRAAHPSAAVIDLSGDLRLPTPDAYASWYGQAHPAPELLGDVPYGLTEVYRERLRGARLVANPGCYATSVLLPLAPLLAARLVEADDVVVDAKSGVTGAGRTLREDLLFGEVAENLSAYAPGRTHRHVGEIEAVLEERAGRPVELSFCPHLLPVRRGILSAVYVRSTHPAAEIRDALARAYAGERFVLVQEALPKLSDVVGTNLCRIAVRAAAPGRAVLFAALDNLLKGAAGQALQNLNLALGLPEQRGLPLEHLA